MDSISNVEALLQRMEEAAEKSLDASVKLREDIPNLSAFFYMMHGLLKEGAGQLQIRVPKEMEIEGGGHTWFFVCPECHVAIDRTDHFCRHCGQAVR